ncbi:MAG: hypothetical protein ACRCUY_08545, partial [Thermoguttaceae bacterium]
MKNYFYLLLILIVLCVQMQVYAETVRADAANENEIVAAINSLTRNLDSETGFPLGTQGVSKGYHTNLERGVKVRPTRAAMELAALYLASPREEDRKKGVVLLEKVLLLQDTNPESRTFGLWAWYADEPLSKMATPDFNWADFQGATLAGILIHNADRLSPELLAKTKFALECCCRAIFKRNVGASYTNIAVMGGVVTAAGGEILGRNDLLEYARKRLKHVLDYYRETGGFNEYNSPNYAMTVVNDLERLLDLVKDEECRTIAETLLFETLKGVAEHYHVPTGQWSGPHSRAYQDRLSRKTRLALQTRAGLVPASG